MAEYKIIGYLTIFILFAVYGAWLSKEKSEGRGNSFWHKDLFSLLIEITLLPIIKFLSFLASLIGIKRMESYKYIILFGITLTILAVLFPPWGYSENSSFEKFSFIFSPSGDYMSILWPILGVEIIIISLVSIAGAVVFRKEKG